MKRRLLPLLLLFFFGISYVLAQSCQFTVNPSQLGSSCLGQKCPNIQSAVTHGAANSCTSLSLALNSGRFTGPNNVGINFQTYPLQLLSVNITGKGAEGRLNTTIDAQLTNYIFSANSTINTIFSLTKLILANGLNQNNGGCVSFQTMGTVDFTNVGFSNCKSFQNGGAAYLSSDNFLLSFVGFRSNSATLNGGGLYVDSITNSTNNYHNGLYFYNNVASNGGGAYFASQNANAIGLVFDKNVASMNGGGLAVQSSGSFTNVVAYQNYALNGSGIYVSNSSANQEVVFLNANITNNLGYTGKKSDISNGGGFYISNPNTLINGSIITYNQASNGGAVFLGFDYPTDEKCPLNISDSTFYNNSAINNGGGLYCDNACANLGTSTFDDNTVGGQFSDTDNVYCDGNCQSSVCTYCPCDKSCDDCQFGCALSGPTCSCLFPEDEADNYSNCPHCTIHLILYFVEVYNLISF
eukprot:TRINITY_DN650_c0_g1_i1.p1 TRINITY_DN650_c0_g1~~TRINITY_DN650_c0_g1_i1.p1  ORF type:complete len:488 (-),score=37.66 TRINITY_DN650_c0_g1_i1:413-1816(-)